MDTRCFSSPIFAATCRLKIPAAAVAWTLLLAFSVFMAPPAAHGQTYTMLHNFTGRGDGAYPDVGALDQAGNVYGSTLEGGYFGQYCQGGCGTVFKLARNNNGSWTETLLHTFTYELGVEDGRHPVGVAFGPDGLLYGVTSDLTAFSLAPPATICTTATCPWSETILAYSWPYCEGSGPNRGITPDGAGAFYDTTQNGGEGDVGSIFRIVQFDTGWYCQDVHWFDWFREGGQTAAGVSVVGETMYGATTRGGPSGNGVLYSTVQFGGFDVLHAFKNAEDGAAPAVTPIIDAAGNVYGTTSSGGMYGAGTVFEWSPPGSFEVIYSFTATGGSGPLTLDSAGNIYGTIAWGGAYGKGAVFKLTRGENQWSYNSLHDFNGDDGMSPSGKIVLGTNGKLYGSTDRGGAYGYGVVWEITP